MNVNNIMNLYCRTTKGGYAKKETMMATKRWWRAPGKVALTSTNNQYHIWTLDSTNLENQKKLIGLELNASQAGR
jgi:hypothetical protein